MCVHHLLDVGRIDVLPAGQDHVLLAIDDVEEALVVEAADVAGAQPAAAMGIRPRGLRCRVRAVVVMLHYESAAADDLAGRAGGGFAVVVTDQLELLAGDRLADRFDPPIEVLGRERRDDALGQAVELDQLAAEPVARCALEVRRQRRATAHDRLQRTEPALLEVGQLEQAAELQRHETAVRDAVTLDELDEAGGTEGRHDHQRAADQDRRQHRGPADVRVQPERAQRNRATVVAQRQREIRRPVHPAGVAVNDALRQPGRARAVDDVALRFRQRSQRRRLGRLPVAPARELLPAGCRWLDAQPQQRGRQATRRCEPLDASALLAARRNGGGPAVADHRGHGIIRHRQVERHDADAGLAGPEQHLGHLGAVVHQHCDSRPGLEPLAPQAVADPIGGAIELAPAEPALPAEERRLAGQPPPVLGDQVRDQGIGHIERTHWSLPANPDQRNEYPTLSVNVRGGP